MKRLTFDGNYCDIAQCAETRGGSFCEDGACSQRKVWERLKEWEDLEEQGRVIVMKKPEQDSMARLRELADADVAPVVHGRWVRQDETRTKFMCSLCESKNYGGHEKFCPNCGAKMDGDGNG